jgi:hypothetical protein
MFCALGLIFDGVVCVGSRLHVLRACSRFKGYRGVESCFHVSRAGTRFRRYQGHQIPFLCFARPDSFSAVPRASGLVFMVCAPGFIFGGTQGVGSRFHVLRSPTSFLRYRGRRVPFSCIVLPDSFSTIPRASGTFFMFCEPGIVFGDTEGVGSRFHVLRSRTRFRRYGGRVVPFSCFARPDSFSAVPRASGPVFMFCAPGLNFGGTEGVGSDFHVLRSRTHFRRYRGRRVPFSCFACWTRFRRLPRASGPVFLFFAPVVVFSAIPKASGPVFMFCAPVLIFSGTEGVGSRFHVLRSRTHFRRYRGRRFSFLCFARPDPFSAVRRASGPFSCFARPDSFSAVSRASGPVFMFCTPGLVFGGTEGVSSSFHVLRARTKFRRYRERQVRFS